MAKKKTVYICQNCNYESPKWLGKCPECSEWNTLEESAPITQSSSAGTRRSKSLKDPKTISEITAINIERTKTYLNEFDRVVGGGLVPGSLSLIGGQPGIGKSTLLLEVMSRLSSKYKDKKILYVSGEESESQIAGRAKRMGVSSENLLILNETSWQNILEVIQKERPSFLVVDSIQTTVSQDIQSAPGTVSQIREVTYELMNHVKTKGITCFIVGHITKDGNIAGPKILEHMVDTVIYFEGDQFGQYRILRAIKNRFGNTNEVGIFEMEEAGLKEVPNPSQYFLDDQLEDSYGRSLTCILEGSRPLFIEIQALVVENKFGNGRRTTQGIDQNRLSMMVAIIEKYFELPLSYNDIYLNVVGGFKLSSRESDLSIIASLLSSYKGRAIKTGEIFLGEVGLTGEVRSVPMIESRLKEIQQLNYEVVYTSLKTAVKFKDKFKKLKLIGIKRAKDLESYL
ncbi:MAG: DNA repair protein RadA [Halobacteriovoraceae bacterium]|nr:DNA repair protein RadA [Halobacteriovoraceae bacterium]|tara:strand:- start:5388 stop:6755 length:1368 start_codon:yes stop_codon:yes gene_type:complete